MNGDPDWAIRAQAFSTLERLVIAKSGRIPWADIDLGFQFEGQHMHFASKALGIFKPRQMSAALSLKTTVPKGGRRTWYRDQNIDIDHPTGLMPYDLARGGLGNSANLHLQIAYKRRAPLIYFYGVEPALYEVFWPVWVAQFNEAEERILLSVSDAAQSNLGAPPPQPLSARLQIREKSYSQVQSRHRNHQAWFSSRTKSAYGYRCAFSGLPLRSLLVGAHIVPDAENGPASVNNGICMSTLHHTAFDTNLIGVDPDLRIHVAEKVIRERDGPLLENLRQLHGTKLRTPSHADAHPNRKYLELRFARFQAAGR